MPRRRPAINRADPGPGPADPGSQSPHPFAGLSSRECSFAPKKVHSSGMRASQILAASPRLDQLGEAESALAVCGTPPLGVRWDVQDSSSNGLAEITDDAMSAWTRLGFVRGARLRARFFRLRSRPLYRRALSAHFANCDRGGISAPSMLANACAARGNDAAVLCITTSPAQSFPEILRPCVLEAWGSSTMPTDLPLPT